MLVLASWLYEDFPGVELVVNLADTPIPCALDVPWLQAATLKGAFVARRQKLGRKRDLLGKRLQMRARLGGPRMQPALGGS